MLELRRATVVETRSPPGASEAAGEAALVEPAAEQLLTVELDGARRAAVADVGMVGLAQVGDEVVVNVQALDLGLGSGGFDVIHVNLTRGLHGGGDGGARVMKLNYTSLQHAVSPVESAERLELPLERPVGVLALHGQLAPVAWELSRAAPGVALGYVQTAGGALAGAHSLTVCELRRQGLLAGHITAGAAFGGEREAISTAGAIDHGLRELGWDAVLCGPGPGIIGSGTALGHGGMAALDSAHTALALGCPTLVVARMSSSDERARHRGISHHTLTVLDLLLEPVTVAIPAGMRSPVGSDLRAGLRGVYGQAAGRPGLRPDVARPARIARHDWRRAPVGLREYALSGLPDRTMGRTLVQDPMFFGAALAAGAVLAQLIGDAGRAPVALEPAGEAE